MASTSGLGGPCPRRLELQAAGAGTRLFRVESWGKSCLSPGRARGTKALAGEWAGIAGARGSRRPRWVATAPLAAVLVPGALFLCRIPLASAASARKQRKGVFLGSLDLEILGTLAGRVPAVQGSALHRERASIFSLSLPTLCHTVPQSFQVVPNSPPLCPPPRKKN